jgi:gliding-associated putative ABC transporter substrate-binding component GldG
MLEYNFANAIAKIQQETKPEIGYAIGNGEPMDYSVYDLAEMVLKPNYNLSIVNLSTQKFINPDFKALLIVKPKNAFTDQQKLEIDQYLMNGGKLLFFVDRLNAEMDSLQIKNQVIAYDRELGLNDLLFRYGVRINPNLVMDLQCDYLPFDVNGNGQFEFLPWNYFPVLESSNNHPINKNLGFVAGRFVNSIDTSEVDGIKKTVLLQTSVNGRIMGTPALISGTENSSAPEDEKFKTPHIPVAVLLEGKFKSFFANRLSSEMQDTLSKYGMTFMPYASHVGKLIVAGDGDLVLNQVVKGNQPLPMGMNAYTYGTQRQFPFANKEFLLNSLDYLIDENGLSEAKGKEYIVRLLDTKKVNAEKMYWQMLNIFSPILLMGFFTFIINWIKKRKYTNK